MKSNSLRALFGFAVTVDLRNFSEIGRRLLIQEKKPFSNRLKQQIYSVIFDFLSETLEAAIISSSNDVLFDYKHTGDGFLLLTKHNRYKTPNTLDSFLLLLDIYMLLDRLVPELNFKIIDLLKNNAKIVRGNSHLRYIKSIFTDESGKSWKQHIGFSIGAHCGMIFYRNVRDQKIFLGNTINQSSRFQALSTTFSDYNLFFSEEISRRLSQTMGTTEFHSEISRKWFKNLERITIKGIGPTAVHAIENRHVGHVKEKLMCFNEASKI